MWTPQRARALVRAPSGRFKLWRGGASIATSKIKHNNYQGIATHIGQGFKREHGRPARVGEIHRTRTKSGAYHKQAVWYIRTPKGWRKSPTMTRKPTSAEISAELARARLGRRTRARGPKTGGRA